MVLNDLADSFCHSQKNAGLKGLIESDHCRRLHAVLASLFSLTAGHGVLIVASHAFDINDTSDKKCCRCFSIS